MTKTSKAIVLAGGSGTRLYPITLGVSKHLIPIYDKPMIYYPISVLMLAGIREILVITNIRDLSAYKRLLGDGSDFGIEITYECQDKPKGLVDAFIIGESFISNKKVALILGDNIFYGQSFSEKLTMASNSSKGATVFTHHVSNPENFGVLEIDIDDKPISISEKPNNPKSNLAITGLYFYDERVVELSKTIKPSLRGELEITDLNNLYLKEDNLTPINLGRGFTWLDTGNKDALLEAGQFVQTLEQRQGLKIACLEEIAFYNKWIDAEKLRNKAQSLNGTDYGSYLEYLVAESL